MTVRSRAARLTGPLHDRLVLYAITAAALGLLLPDLAGRLSAGVPYMLAGQVLGVSLTLTAGQMGRALRRPLPLLVALAAQWTVLPLIGVALLHLSADPAVGQGLLIVAVSPAEITSALVAVLAAGSGSAAIACMAGSLCAGIVLTPLWVSTVLGPGAHVDQAALILELALAVAVPLVVGIGLGTVLRSAPRLRPRALDLSALCVVLVVFVSAGSARSLVLSPALGACLAGCAALLAAGAALGLLVARPWRGEPHLRRALVFPVGMREFGVAAAVALSVSPRAVGVTGVYGAMLMVSAPALARRLRPRHAAG